MCEKVRKCVKLFSQLKNMWIRNFSHWFLNVWKGEKKWEKLWIHMWKSEKSCEFTCENIFTHFLNFDHTFLFTVNSQWREKLWKYFLTLVLTFKGYCMYCSPTTSGSVYWSRIMDGSADTCMPMAIAYTSKVIAGQSTRQRYYSSLWIVGSSNAHPFSPFICSLCIHLLCLQNQRA